ncbi:MAG TPA: SDR family oxidoreductase [Solirubrobacteraceae bacterium]|nr:SDR family oxidoreductase [Solirubrobacteraceae bacterium]
MTRPLAVVTGASRGIGREVAVMLAAGGADLVLVGRTDDQLEVVAELVTAAGGAATTIVADLATAAGTEHAVAELGRLPGPVAILVNNAGAAGPYGAGWELDPLAWERMLHLNLTAPFRLCAGVVPGMIAAGFGRIVNVTSSASLEPLERTGAYSVAKAGLNMLTRQLAAELREHAGISVVALAPGPADTATYAELADQPAELVGVRGFERYRRTVAEGRLSPPRRPARVIAALAFEPTAARSGAYVDIGDEYATRALESGS